MTVPKGRRFGIFKFRNNTGDGNTTSVKVPQESNTLTQCPTSMALLFILCLVPILVTITEGFIIFYHSMIFAECEFSLNTLGLGQADLIYHGIFIMAPIYQLSLYLDILRQRNIIQLFTLILFGKFKPMSHAVLNIDIIGIIMVIFSGIQTVQHMILEEAGCYLDFQNGNKTITFPNSTTVSSIKMSVIISNSTQAALDYQDNIDAGVSNIRPFEYAVIAIIGIGFIIMLGCSIKLYKLFRWENYLSHIFLDIHLRNALISWAIFTGLLKIDFFFIFAYAIQLVPAALIGYTNIPAFECIIVFGISLVGFLLAIHSIRNEDMRTLSVFNITISGSIGYFGYRLYTFRVRKEAISDPFWASSFQMSI